MVVKRRLGVLLAGTVLGASFLITAPAFADDAQMQQQINTMQRQLQAMQDQLAQTKKEAAPPAQQQASTAQQQASSRPAAGAEYSAESLQCGPADPDQGAARVVRQRPHLAGRHVHRDGRCVAQRNEISSGASDPPFGTIPFQNSPLWSENEVRFSAQQSRIAFKATGDIDPAQHLKGYYEMDFLGACDHSEFARKQQLHAAHSPSLFRVR